MHGHGTDQIINIACFVFHTSWMAFLCLGWIWPRTRPWQIAIVVLTAVSWFGLGIRYGWGYCPLTDWHWQVRARLGHHDPPSYIQLLVQELTGIDPGPALADTVAVLTLGTVALLGIALYARDRRVRRTVTPPSRGVTRRAAP
jgi:Protein of Unknown function (DUF2784)